VDTTEKTGGDGTEGKGATCPRNYLKASPARAATRALSWDLWLKRSLRVGLALLLMTMGYGGIIWGCVRNASGKNKKNASGDGTECEGARRMSDSFRKESRGEKFRYD